MTLAELIRMRDARRRAEWARTAEILAMLYNVNRGPNQSAIAASKLNPYPDS